MQPSSADGGPRSPPLLHPLPPLCAAQHLSPPPKPPPPCRHLAVEERQNHEVAVDHRRHQLVLVGHNHLQLDGGREGEKKEGGGKEGEKKDADLPMFYVCSCWKQPFDPSSSPVLERAAAMQHTGTPVDVGQAVVGYFVSWCCVLSEQPGEALRAIHLNLLHGGAKHCPRQQPPGVSPTLPMLHAAAVMMIQVDSRSCKSARAQGEKRDRRILFSD